MCLFFICYSSCFLLLNLTYISYTRVIHTRQRANSKEGILNKTTWHLSQRTTLKTKKNYKQLRCATKPMIQAPAQQSGYLALASTQWGQYKLMDWILNKPFIYINETGKKQTLKRAKNRLYTTVFIIILSLNYDTYTIDL